jgi:hypothetical protein
MIPDGNNQGARPANDAPSLASDPVLSATTAKPGERISFSVAASDPDNDPLTFAWNFGDGITRAGNPVEHSYLSPGAYAANISVSDGRGAAAVANMIITIETDIDSDVDGVGDTLDTDDDNDGIPDTIEAALGFATVNPASTPFGGGGIPPSSALTLKSFSSKLDFSRANNDSLNARGTVASASGETLGDLRAVIVIGSVTRSFQLSSHGASLTTSQDKFSIKFGKAGGAFSVRLKRTALMGGFLQEDLAAANSASKALQPTTVNLFVNGSYYSAQPVLLYTRKNSRGSLILQK